MTTVVPLPVGIELFALANQLVQLCLRFRIEAKAQEAEAAVRRWTRRLLLERLLLNLHRLFRPLGLELLLQVGLLLVRLRPLGLELLLQRGLLLVRLRPLGLELAAVESDAKTCE
eukprot:COSAG06_NODE_39935_length_407_cov_0.853896_1_plen_115_part_00